MADNIEIKRDDQVISLRDYMDLRFRANEEQTRLAMAASKEAIIKSENATEKRFESVNEFRRTLADQALQFIPRVEAEKELESLRNKIEEISKTGALRLEEATKAVTGRFEEAHKGSTARFDEAVKSIQHRLDETIRVRAESMAALTTSMTTQFNDINLRINSISERGKGMNDGWMLLVALAGPVIAIAVVFLGR
jgi:DNA anti-recombination protein RmuC